MTDDRLAEIAALYAETKGHDQLYGSGWVNAACGALATMPELIEEVKRGRAIAERLLEVIKLAPDSGWDAEAVLAAVGGRLADERQAEIVAYLRRAMARASAESESILRWVADDIEGGGWRE